MRQIISKLALSHRIERLAKTPACIILKGHTENFHASTPCKLIHPCKRKNWKINKLKLRGTNNYLLAKLNKNPWRDTCQVIHCFKKLEDKYKSKFIQLNIKEFQHSITEKALDKAISFASSHTTISVENIRIIKHSRN